MATTVNIVEKELERAGETPNQGLLMEQRHLLCR